MKEKGSPSAACRDKHTFVCQSSPPCHRQLFGVMPLVWLRCSKHGQEMEAQSHQTSQPWGQEPQLVNSPLLLPYFTQKRYTSGSQTECTTVHLSRLLCGYTSWWQCWAAGANGCSDERMFRLSFLAPSRNFLEPHPCGWPSLGWSGGWQTTALGLPGTTREAWAVERPGSGMKAPMPPGHCQRPAPGDTHLLPLHLRRGVDFVH